MKKLEFQKLKEKYLSEGWEENWGDGAINQKNLCILAKSRHVKINQHKENLEMDYVVLSRKFRTVTFYNVGSYSS